MTRQDELHKSWNAVDKEKLCSMKAVRDKESILKTRQDLVAVRFCRQIHAFFTSSSDSASLRIGLAPPFL
jgi:hypothetical protein